MRPFWKFIFLIVLAIAFVGGLAIYQFWGERYRLVLTEEQLIAKLNEKFPFDKTYFFGLVTKKCGRLLAQVAFQAGETRRFP